MNYKLDLGNVELDGTVTAEVLSFDPATKVLRVKMKGSQAKMKFTVVEGEYDPATIATQSSIVITPKGEMTIAPVKPKPVNRTNGCNDRSVSYKSL